MLMSLRSPDLDYQMRSRDALIHVEDSIRKKDVQVIFCLFWILYFKTKMLPRCSFLKLHKRFQY